MMSRARFINIPTGTHTIKMRRAFERHDHANFTLGVNMVRPLDGQHMHNINREATRFRTWLYGTTKFDAVVFALAEPTLLIALLDQIGQRSKILAIGGILRIQPVSKARIQRFVANGRGNGVDACLLYTSRCV